MFQTAEQQAMLELLDEAPLRSTHYWLWLLSTGGTMLGGYSVFTLGVALPILVHTEWSPACCCCSSPCTPTPRQRSNLMTVFAGFILFNLAMNVGPASEWRRNCSQLSYGAPPAALPVLWPSRAPRSGCSSSRYQGEHGPLRRDRFDGHCQRARQVDYCHFRRGDRGPRQPRGPAPRRPERRGAVAVRAGARQVSDIRTEAGNVIRRQFSSLTISSVSAGNIITSRRRTISAAMNGRTRR